MFRRLRELRKMKGLTCEDMAAVLGLKTKAAYSKKERGKTKFSLKDARKKMLERLQGFLIRVLTQFFLKMKYLLKTINSKEGTR